jgi:hypothetical protein
MDSVRDVSAAFVSPLVLTTYYLPYGEVGVPYEVVLEVHGGIPPYIASIAQGAMPEGLHLIAGPAISGTPTKGQSASFTLSVTDSAGTSVEGKFKTRMYKSLAITTKELPTEKGGQTYKAKLKAKGGKQPYSWSLQGGSLPDGLTLDTITGIIAGIPRETGTFVTTFEVSDVLRGRASKTFTWSVTP